LDNFCRSVQHPHSSSHETVSQTSAVIVDVEETCDLGTEDMGGQSIPCETSVEVLQEISQQDETNVEYQKLKGLDNFCRSVQHPHSSSHETVSQTSAVIVDVEETCDLGTEDMGGQSIPCETSVEVLQEISQQDETNVEYQKLKGAESHLDEIARRCLREGLAGALKELRITIEQADRSCVVHHG
ncbi:hypothetical protein OSTOST_02907, partial [Ostertagia ostertagi]